MFSVIMPAYNAEKCIGRAIASVLGQSRKDWELLVIDDGSTDGTDRVVSGFADPRLRYFYQENGGVSAARNRGIREAQGDYICFLDADDAWRENHLAELWELIKLFPDCGLYCTGHDLRLTDGRLVHWTEKCFRGAPGQRFLCPDGYAALARYGYFLITGALCVPAAVLERVGPFELGVRSGEDDDLWLRIFAYYPVAVSRAATMEYDRRQSGLTARRAEKYENPFPGRVEGLLRDPAVTADRRESLRTWLARNRLSRSRQCLLAGDKAGAGAYLRGVEPRRVPRRRYLTTRLALLLPAGLLRWVVERRDRHYYRDK